MVEKIQKLIQAKGISQSAFEVMLGLPQARISKWASGNGEPSVSQAWRMAKLLCVPLDYLADDELEDPPVQQRTEREQLLWGIVELMGVENALRVLVPDKDGSDAVSSSGVAADRTQPRRGGNP